MNSNQETTQESTNNKVIVSETNYIEEITEGDFTINFKIINQQQRKELILKDVSYSLIIGSTAYKTCVDNIMS